MFDAAALTFPFQNIEMDKRRAIQIMVKFSELYHLKCENSALPSKLPYDQQERLLEPLNALGAEYKITGDGTQHFVEFQDKKCRIVSYPAMWSDDSSLPPVGTIAIADKLLKYALPKAGEIIRVKLC